ncbi:Nudix hydrolase 15, mitochondrial, partial [Mucuna pruriens]
MGSNRQEVRGSERLQALVRHLNSSYSMPTHANNFDSKLTVSKRAAVLICVFEGGDGNLRVFLTQRASSLSTHSGEVSLPGGKTEEGDADDVQTALREAKEEIGLDPSLVSVITLLEPFHTKYGVTIIPVVGILSDKDAFSPILNPAEVEAIFDVPLELFLKNDYRRAEEREWMGEKHLVHYFDYEVGNKKYVIWAITAAILIRAATLLLQRPPAFLEQRPKIWGGITESDIVILAKKGMDSKGSRRLQALLDHLRSNSMSTNANNYNSNITVSKRAAVLICVFEGGDGNLRVFLTQRASSLSTHSGEVALPGGKREETDADDVQTALREAKEEIGLDPSLVSVITLLQPFHTKYGVTVIPVVGILSDKDAFSPVLDSAEVDAIFDVPLEMFLKYGVTIIPVVGILSNKDAFSPILNPAEVEAIFDVPLELFLKNDYRRAEEREWMGEKHLVHYFDYEVGNKKYVIWAITAAILIRVATLLLKRLPAFLEQRPKIWGEITER